jgi:hypothetical protein
VASGLSSAPSEPSKEADSTSPNEMARMHTEAEGTRAKPSLREGLRGSWPHWSSTRGASGAAEQPTVGEVMPEDPI